MRPARRMFLALAAALLAQSAGAAAPAAGADWLARPTIWRGTLGEKQIQMWLQPKAAPEIGLEGQYFVFGGGGQPVLLAGEAEGSQVLMEESENGVDVSGDWEATLEGNTLRGTWRSIDDQVVLPFALTAVGAPPAGEKLREH